MWFEALGVYPRPGQHIKRGTQSIPCGFVKGELKVSEGPKPYAKVQKPDGPVEPIRLSTGKGYVAYCKAKGGKIWFVAVVTEGDYTRFESKYLPSDARNLQIDTTAVLADTSTHTDIPIFNGLFGQGTSVTTALEALVTATQPQLLDEGLTTESIHDPTVDADTSSTGSDQVEKFKKRWGDVPLARRLKLPSTIP